MKKILGISMAILMIIGIGMVVYIGLGIVRAPSFSNKSHEVPTTDLPKDVPIINGKIVSSKTTRSDDFTRGIEIVVETSLSLKEVVQYYSNEFTKRDIIVGTLPEFQRNTSEIENSTEAHAIAETKSHLGIVVSIQSEPQITLVKIQIKGNSILFLPKD